MTNMILRIAYRIVILSVFPWKCTNLKMFKMVRTIGMDSLMIKVSCLILKSNEVDDYYLWERGYY